MGRILVNIRCMKSSLTGVQRYVKEVLSNSGDDFETITPSGNGVGTLGHLWEQIVLPLRSGDGLIWSPANTGPLSVQRQVVTLHDMVPLDHPEWFTSKFGMWWRWLIPKLAKRSMHIIAVSEFTKSRILHHTDINPNKITVIYNGVDSRFSPQSEDRIATVRQTLKLPTNRYILSMGSVEPRKNLHRLLSAWALICGQVPNDCWLVVAGGKGKASMFKEVEFHQIPERVHFAGYINDDLLPSLYSGALALAYTSLYEGFGLPPLEAMACGTPIIISNSTALVEISGDAGIQVDPFDAQSIGFNILKVINDAAFRQKSRELGLSRSGKFSWKTTASQTTKLLKQIAQE